VSSSSLFRSAIVFSREDARWAGSIRFQAPFFATESGNDRKGSREVT